MKITVDLRMKRLVTVAEIKGSLDANLIAEPAMRALVKKMLVKSFKQSNDTFERPLVAGSRLKYYEDSAILNGRSRHMQTLSLRLPFGLLSTDRGIPG